MFTVHVFAWIVFVLLITTAGFGVISLIRWSQHAAVPRGKVAAHIGLQTVAISLWITFAVTMNVWLGWIAFIVITIGQVLGDLLMFASYRLRNRLTENISYAKVASEVLGFKRPVVSWHAILGAVGYFLMLVVAIVKSVLG